MLDTIFVGLFESTGYGPITVLQFLLCIGISLVIGLILSLMYRYKSQCTRSFLLTLAMLPAVVCVVILMVNGNIGAGVAIAGAFSLVRFRSVPGTAKEIGAIFLAMTTGLMTGMGQLGYAVLFALLMSAIWVLYQFVSTRNSAVLDKHRTLRITIPEDLNYTDVFTEPLNKYTSSAELVNVKTTNLGSLFKLTYRITLRSVTQEKALIDDLRCRNGNLEISLMRQEGNSNEL
ncbi:MAG: DUF4956 domain-containing protein [Ruminococcaceae bacterium]|nr:DUF4956 domain-containing protein [Oscillospiraceae bacterium]